MSHTDNRNKNVKRKKHEKAQQQSAVLAEIVRCGERVKHIKSVSYWKAKANISQKLIRMGFGCKFLTARSSSKKSWSGSDQFDCDDNKRDRMVNGENNTFLISHPIYRQHFLKIYCFSFAHVSFFFFRGRPNVAQCDDKINKNPWNVSSATKTCFGETNGMSEWVS